MLLILVMLSCTEVKRQDGTIEQDKLSENHAFNKELLIPIGPDIIAAYAMIAEGGDRKETVIFISGYPGNDSNFDLAMDIRASGKNAFMFNHRGAWGSQGVYSYSHCLEDVDAIVKFLCDAAIFDQLRVDTLDFTLLGRSLGGGVALIQGSLNKKVSSIIAISSVNYGDLMKDYQSLDELGGFKKYMKKQIMMNHEIDEFLLELLENKDKFNILTYAKELSDKRVLFIEDSEKNKNWKDQLIDIETILLGSDHNFINKRDQMIGIIVEWIHDE